MNARWKTLAPPLFMVVLAAVLVVKAVSAYSASGPLGAGLLRPVAVVVGVVVVGVALWACGGQPRARTGHVHGGTRRVRAVHEAGHVVAARALGARVTSVTIDGSRPGVSWSGSRASSAEGIAYDVITFMHAGQAAAGSRRGCSADRARVQRAAETRARQIVRTHRSEIGRVAARLERGTR